VHRRNDRLTKQVNNRAELSSVQIPIFRSYQDITKFTDFYQTKRLKVRLRDFSTKAYFAMSDTQNSVHRWLEAITVRAMI